MSSKKILIIFIALCCLIGCSKKNDNRGVLLDVEILPEMVTDFSFIKMKYNFNVSDKFSPLDKNYKLFVHFWRPKLKEMLLQDDHSLPTDTTAWKAGDVISYDRELFIPKFLDEFDLDFEGFEEVKFTVGLYNPEDQDDTIILYRKTLNIQSASLIAPEIVYDEGWWQPEKNLNIKNPEERSWTWTSKRAVCIIEKPKSDKNYVLIIKGAVNKANLENQKITFFINDQKLEEFVPEKNIFSKKFIIPPDKLGDQEEFNFIIETNKTFIPSALDPNNNDNRELGIQVYFLYFREAFL